MTRALAVAAGVCALGLVACGEPEALYTSEPMKVSLAGAGGADGLFAQGSFGDDPAAPLFSLLIDSGSGLTAHDDLNLDVRSDRQPLRVWSTDDPAVQRVRFPESVVFDAPLGGTGFAPTTTVGGILGGDLLSRFVVRIDYPAQTLAFEPRLIACGCELANDCQAVFRFPEAGGELKIVVGHDQFTYAPTRILLDACLEPVPDPIATEPCIVDNAPTPSAAYLPAGTDVKLQIATGFPGILMGASAYDRLRGPGAAAALLGATPEALSLPELGGRTVTVARATLGDATHSALALVSREAFFGPCGELARSRRQRRVPPDDLPTDDPERACLVKRSTKPTPGFVDGCKKRAGDATVCDDTDPNSPTAAFIEFGPALPIFVAADTVEPLAAINADVLPASIALDDRASSPAVELIVGTGALRSLALTLDYPQNRVAARCLDDAACRTYPRYVKPDHGGCDPDSLCTRQRDLRALAGTERAGGRCYATTP